MAERPRKSDLTRQRILDAAAKVFRAKGYAGARLADIAEAAGMQAGSLYYHFSSREELVEEVMRTGTLHTHEAVVAAVAAAGSDPLVRLRAAIGAHVQSVIGISDLASATIKLFGQVPDEVWARVLVHQRAYGAVWRDLLSDARDAGLLRADVDLAAMRMAILGALNWTVEWYQPGGASPERLAKDIGTMVLDGLRLDRG